MNALAMLSLRSVAVVTQRLESHWKPFLQQPLVIPHSAGVSSLKRVVAGRYDHWFQWYMRTQRFRAFHTVVFVDPVIAFSDDEYGGYLDGLFARLLGKTCQIIVINRPGADIMPTADELRTKAVLRALLYGTRLSKPKLLERARLTLVPVPEDVLVKALGGLGLQVWGSQTRYQLDSDNENLLQAMVPRAPPRSEEGEPGHVGSLFKREKRFRAEARIPDKMLAAVPKLDLAGKASDDLVVKYEGEEARLSEAYRQFAANLLQRIEDGEHDTITFRPFVYDLTEPRNILQA